MAMSCGRVLKRFAREEGENESLWPEPFASAAERRLAHHRRRAEALGYERAAVIQSPARVKDFVC
jgi:hypothetical protein